MYKTEGDLTEVLGEQGMSLVVVIRTMHAGSLIHRVIESTEMKIEEEE